MTSISPQAQLRDPLGLVGASFGTIIEYLDEVLTELAKAQTTADKDEEGSRGIDSKTLHSAWRASLDALADESVSLTRRGSHEDLVEAGILFGKLRVSDAGQALRHRHPEYAGALAGIGRVLSAAAEPASETGADAALRSWRGKPKEIVELLAGRPDDSMPRQEIRDRLDVSESLLSHMLAAMEDSQLAFRVREPGRKARDVVLGPEGRAEIQRWTEHAEAVDHPLDHLIEEFVQEKLLRDPSSATARQDPDPPIPSLRTRDQEDEDEPLLPEPRDMLLGWRDFASESEPLETQERSAHSLLRETHRPDQAEFLTSTKEPLDRSLLESASSFESKKSRLPLESAGAPAAAITASDDSHGS